MDFSEILDFTFTLFFFFPCSLNIVMQCNGLMIIFFKDLIKFSFFFFFFLIDEKMKENCL